MTNAPTLAAEALLNAGKALGTPFDHPDGGKASIVPVGYTVVRHTDPLHHVAQTVVMLDQASFADYINRFKTEHTRVFADYRRPHILGIIDYHTAGNNADFAVHRASFTPPWSEQWNRWRGIDGRSMGQGDFAEFLEENYLDIAEPPAAELLDVVANLQAKKNVDFQSGIRLQDGSTQLTYNEKIESKGKGALKVPAEFFLGVPVFFGGAAYKVRVLLRYRISEGALSFIVKLNRREFVEQTAFGDITKAIEEATTIKPYSGGLAA